MAGMPSNLLTRSAALAATAALAVGLAACSGSPEPSPTGDLSGVDAGPGRDTSLDEYYVTPGKLTVATGEPAYYPYVIDDDPASGEGFEAAIAYGVANALGFGIDDVVWVRSSFDDAIAPGPKAYDFNIQQISITDERERSIDFSSPYYAAGQAVITVEGSPAAEATSIADLKGLVIGAATGTTSLKAVEELIAPTDGAQVFGSNDDAKLALESGQIDAIVVDVPTAFYITGVELDGGVIVGQLPDVDGETDEWGLALAKGSELTEVVTKAVDALRERGTLETAAEAWLGADQGVPLLK